MHEQILTLLGNTNKLFNTHESIYLTWILLVYQMQNCAQLINILVFCAGRCLFVNVYLQHRNVSQLLWRLQINVKTSMLIAVCY